MADLPDHVDVAIVGGGPAGLAAATELRHLGIASVLLLERDGQAGGVPRFCGHSPFGLREFRRPMRGPAYAAALRDAAIEAGALIRTGTTVTALGPGLSLTASSDAGTQEITARAILLATGTREASRAARLIGGTKPGGILSTGALQNLVYGSHARPFRRPVILGSELVSFSALLTCRHAGIRPLAMIEPGARITARRPSHWLARALGVPLHLATDLAEIRGQSHVSSVLLSSLTGDTEMETDGVIVTGRFRPEATLARLSGIEIDTLTGGPAVDQSGRCSLPGIYAAGNMLRPVETAGWCWQEARAIARAIASDLALPPAPATATIALAPGPLKYAMPQRLSGGPDAALPRLQLRVTRPVRGRLILRAGGREIAAHSLSALPERRILLPLPPAAQDITIAVEEAT